MFKLIINLCVPIYQFIYLFIYCLTGPQHSDLCPHLAYVHLLARDLVLAHLQISILVGPFSHPKSFDFLATLSCLKASESAWMKFV